MNKSPNASPQASTVPQSEDLTALLKHKREIQEWLNAAKHRIHELETSYLDEPNSIGNIVKGWDPDGRYGPIKKQTTEDKDRLFSNSSYQVWLDMKSQHDQNEERKQVIVKTESIHNSLKGPKQKKIKRSSSGNYHVDAVDSWTEGLEES